jgi:hypothetical protein
MPNNINQWKGNVQNMIAKAHYDSVNPSVVNRVRFVSGPSPRVVNGRNQVVAIFEIDPPNNNADTVSSAQLLSLLKVALDSGTVTEYPANLVVSLEQLNANNEVIPIQQPVANNAGHRVSQQLAIWGSILLCAVLAV